MYSLVAPNPGVVCNVTNHVLAPYEWVVIIGLEFLGNKLCPCIERLQPFLLEHVC